MPYSNFTLKKVKEEFKLEVVENRDLFSDIEEVEVSDYLKTTLNYNVPLALAISTEKARSELIISNVLLELKKRLNDVISLFSGINLDIDKDRDLNGFCDYIISKSSEQFYISSPIVVIVEAKNEQLTAGLGQCIAEMIASVIFNEREGNIIDITYGAVTTGNTWKFLKYEHNTAYIDKPEYHIATINKIMGILVKMVLQEA
ncbi:MAG: hypothetical protein HQK77_05265 [Desulfobacterales bacterium]|nr:hypothetical protein [Desulfobacterales bacterium]